MSEGNESRFGGQFFDALKSFIHKEKSETDPDYQHDNPQTPEQVIKDLEKSGRLKKKNRKDDMLLRASELGMSEAEMAEIAKLPIPELTRKVLEKEARNLFIDEKEIEEAKTLGQLKERVKRRLIRNQKISDDFAEEILEPFKDAVGPDEIHDYATANSAALKPEHREVVADMKDSSRNAAARQSSEFRRARVPDRTKAEQPEVRTKREPTEVEKLDKKVLDLVEKDLRDLDPASAEYKAKQTELINKYSAEVFDQFVEKNPKQSMELRKLHSGIRSALERKGIHTPGATSAAEPKPDVAAEYDHMFAMARRVGARFHPDASVNQIKSAILRVQDKYENIAKKINPNQKVDDLSAAQLKLYVELAGRGKPFDGKTFDEVSLTDEYQSAFTKAREEQDQFEASLKPKSAKAPTAPVVPKVEPAPVSAPDVIHASTTSAKVEPAPAKLEPEYKTDYSIRPEEESVASGRKLGTITAARVGKFDDLNAPTLREGNEKFKEVTRKVWDDFVVHGAARRGKNGEIYLRKETDLDGRVVAALLHRAGLDTSKVEYVYPGQSIAKKTNLDTGNKDGVVVEDGGETVFVDHHTTKSGNENSAAKETYKLLTEAGLLEKNPQWEKAVDFATKCDNMSYPADAYGPKSARTMVGLRNFLTFGQIVKLSAEGYTPTSEIPEDVLKKLGAGKVYDKQTKKMKDVSLYDYSEMRRKATEQASKRLAQMQEEGLIIDSEKYGKVVVDLGGSLQTGGDAAKAYGAGAYVKWDNKGGFFLSTFGKPLDVKLKDGIPVRDTMWLKPINDTTPNKTNLKEVLDALTNDKLAATGALKQYLEKGTLTAEDKAAIYEAAEAEKELQGAIPGTDEALPTSESGDAPPVTPTGPETRTASGKLEINGRFIDISAVVEQYAHRIADDKVREMLKEGPFYKRIFNRMAEEGWRRSYFEKAKAEISKNGHLNTLIQHRMLGTKYNVETGSDEVNYRVLDEIVRSYEEDFVRAEEKGEIVKDPEIANTLADIFRRHAKGDFKSRKEFDQALGQTDLLAKLQGKKFSDKQAGKEASGLLYVNNFYHLAEGYRDKVLEIIKDQGSENEAAVTAYLAGMMNLDLHLGKADRDLYNNMPEGKLSWLEQNLVNKMENLPILNKVVANPLGYAVFGSLLGQGAAKGLMRAGLITGTAMFFAPTTAALLAGGATSAAFMYWRRGRDLKHDRGMDLRRQALGEEPGGKRTEQIREHGAYDFANSSELTKKLEAIKSKGSATETDKQTVANILARLQIEREYNVDLISVTKKESGELGTRRFGINELRSALRDVQGLSGMSDAELQTYVDQQRAEVVRGIDEVNKKFESFTRKEKIKAGVIGGITGIAAGALTQFGLDQLRGHGLPLMDSHKHGSAIEGLYHMAKGESPYEHYEGALVMHHIAGGPRVKLPEGFEVKDYYENGHHYVDIIDNDHNAVGDVVNAHSNLRHLEIGAEGKFTPEALKVIHNNNFGFAESQASGDVNLGTETHTATVEDLHKMFPDLGKHARVDWHDEPGKVYSNWFHKAIEFEGKQQMQYLHKDPNTGMVYMDLKSLAHNLAENAKRALADPEFGKNPDGSIDHKLVDVAHSLQNIGDHPEELAKHFQAAIIPTEEANRLGLSAVTHDGLVDGYKLPLPKQTWDLFDTESKLHDGSIPFRFMEERFDGHVLNTTQGQNLEIIGGESTKELIPVYEMRPPYNPDWIPPFPFWPRFALEPTIKPGYYGGELTKERRRSFEAEFSDTLLKNPDATLNDKAEIKKYFDRQPKEYVQEVERLSSEAGPMNPECRVSVCIPVAGHQEGNSIYKSLENYLYQTADKKSFELVLFVNIPEQDKNGQRVKPDKTLSEIKRFQQDHPDIPVKVMEKFMPSSEANMGAVRKYLNDATIYRHSQRGNGVKELILVSNDADNKGMAPEYIQNFIEKFDKNPNTDAFLGQLDWDPEAYVRKPLIHIGVRLMQYVDVQARRRNRYPSSGANYAFRSSIYAAVGGYRRNYSSTDAGEDVELGMKIRAARDNSPTRNKTAIQFAGARVSRLYTSARRAEETLARGGAPIEMWDRGFSAFDDEVRKKKWEKTMDKVNFDNAADVKRFLNGLEQIINRTIIRIGGTTSPEVRRSLSLLGIKYEAVSDKKIKITDAKALIAGLKEYQKEGLQILELKTGKSKDVLANQSLRVPRRSTELGSTTELAASVELNKLSAETVKRNSKEVERFIKQLEVADEKVIKETNELLTSLFTEVKQISSSQPAALNQMSEYMKEFGFKPADWKESEGKIMVSKIHLQEKKTKGRPWKKVSFEDVKKMMKTPLRPKGRPRKVTA